MDLTLLVLIIALIVVIVLFVVTLRAGASRTKRAAAAGSGRQAVNTPASAAPPTRAIAPASPTAVPSGVGPAVATSVASTRDEELATAMAGAPATAMEAAREHGPDAARPGEKPLGGRALAAESPGATSGDRVVAAAAGGAGVAGDSVRYTAVIPPETAVAGGAPTLDTQGDGVTAPSAERAEPASAATGGIENGVPAATPLSSHGAPVDAGAAGTGTALELTGPPATRTGAVVLSVTPQRLPYRLAELLGEQRGLEEAITIAHRRIDDIEFGPDPGGAENRVRLAVLRQDLSQKQERLREILFLQDGYHWLQQRQAPERTPDER